jgi:hypothetical protein
VSKRSLDIDEAVLLGLRIIMVVMNISSPPLERLLPARTSSTAEDIHSASDILL